MTNILRHLTSLLGLGLFIFLAFGSSDSSKDAEIEAIKEKAINTVDTATAAIKEEKKPDPTPWFYSKETDPMTNDVRYYAYVNSNNTLNFDFPYQGGSTGQLLVRNMNNRNEIIFSVTKGQIQNSYSGSYVRVKFDDGDVVHYNYSEPDNGRSDLIFISSGSLFISKLKQANELMLEVPFYREGRQVFYFDVNDLKWEH